MFCCSLCFFAWFVFLFDALRCGAAERLMMVLFLPFAERWQRHDLRHDKHLFRHACPLIFFQNTPTPP